MLSILLAVAAAVSNASASLLQRQANRQQAGTGSLQVRDSVGLLRRPLFLAGVATLVLSFALQAAALGTGELSVVQPLLVLELPATLVLAAVVLHSPASRREWTAVLAMSVGLMVLLFALSPGGGRSDRTSGVEWALGLAVGGGLVAVLVVLGLRAAGDLRAGFLGAATGACFGLTAALMDAGFAPGLPAAFAHWQTYGVGVGGLASLFLMQNALQAGRLVAAQPGITLVDPVVAGVWGTVVFGERLRTGPWLLPALVGVALVAWGTVGVSRSSAVHDGDAQGAPRPAATRGPTRRR